MGITYQMEKEGFIFEQTASHPMVYLDNWSFNLFSNDDALASILSAHMNDLHGTLMISNINILEIARRDDKNQIQTIASFVDKMDVAFIELNPLRVIEKEKELEREKIPFDTAKPWLAKQIFEEHVLHAHNFLKEFKFSEVIFCLKDALEAGFVIDDAFERDIFPLIEEARQDTQALDKAKSRFKNRFHRIRSKPPYTEDLYRMCIDFITIKRTMGMPDKEWRDFFQIFVPAAYCDFVLVDRRWANFIETSGLKHPDIARAYDCKKVSRFLQDLVNYPR